MWCVNEKFPNNVCRLCANVSDVLIPIFEESKERIDIKIKKCCLPIEITEDDLKPKSICFKCASKLEIFMELIELSLAADAKFEAILQNVNSNQKAVETVLSQGDEEQVEDEAVKMATMSEAGIESLLAEQEKQQEQDMEDDDSASAQSEWLQDVPSHTDSQRPNAGVLVLGQMESNAGGPEERILVMVELSGTCEQATQSLPFSTPHYCVEENAPEVTCANYLRNNQRTPIIYSMELEQEGKSFGHSYMATSGATTPSKETMFNYSSVKAEPNLTPVQVLSFTSDEDSVSGVLPTSPVLSRVIKACPEASVPNCECLVDSQNQTFKTDPLSLGDNSSGNEDLSNDGLTTTSSSINCCTVSTCDTLDSSSAHQCANSATQSLGSIPTQIVCDNTPEISIKVPTTLELSMSDTSLLPGSSDLDITRDVIDSLSADTSDICLGIDLSDRGSADIDLSDRDSADVPAVLPADISDNRSPDISDVVSHDTSVHLGADSHHNSSSKFLANKSKNISNIIPSDISCTVQADTKCDIFSELSGEKSQSSPNGSKSLSVSDSHLASIKTTSTQSHLPQESTESTSILAPGQVAVTSTFPVSDNAILTDILLLPETKQKSTLTQSDPPVSLCHDKPESPCPTPEELHSTLQPCMPSEPLPSVKPDVASRTCSNEFPSSGANKPSSFLSLTLDAAGSLPPPSAPISLQTSSSGASSTTNSHTIFIATAAIPVSRTAAVGLPEFQTGTAEILFIEDEDPSLTTAMAFTPVIEYKETDSEDNENTSSQSGKFHCLICEKAFKRRAKLNEHMAVHRQEKPFKCDECEKEFFQRWDLTLHKRLHTGLFQCEFCNKTFPVRGKLDRHRRTHTGEKPFACALCGKAFSDMRNLQSHRSTHSDERPHACDTCGKAFRVRSHLVDHYKVHSKDTPFRCDMCGKSFKWKTNLNIHRKVHTGERYPCNLCGNEYIRRADLTKHRRSHVHRETEDVDPLRTVCDPEPPECFTDGALLGKHLRTHDEHRPFVCDICGKGFHLHWYLSSHKKVHVDSKCYTCRTCGKSFNKKNFLLSHARCHMEQGL